MRHAERVAMPVRDISQILPRCVRLTAAGRGRMTRPLAYRIARSKRWYDRCLHLTDDERRTHFLDARTSIDMLPNEITE